MDMTTRVAGSVLVGRLWEAPGDRIIRASVPVRWWGLLKELVADRDIFRNGHRLSDSAPVEDRVFLHPAKIGGEENIVGAVLNTISDKGVQFSFVERIALIMDVLSELDDRGMLTKKGKAKKA